MDPRLGVGIDACLRTSIRTCMVSEVQSTNGGVSRTHIPHFFGMGLSRKRFGVADLKTGSQARASVGLICSRGNKSKDQGLGVPDLESGFSTVTMKLHTMKLQ